MNTRPLDRHESDNLACLNRAGRVSALLFLTETGLRKSILDAAEPLRRLFLESRVHNYADQGQGEASKRILGAQIHTEHGPAPIRASLYRPNTKQGDPRIWFSRFGAYVKSNDVCAVFIHSSEIHLLNLTRSPLAQLLKDRKATPLTLFFETLSRAANTVASELYTKLQTLASAGPIEAVCEGSTAIGRSIETALGIKANSSKTPDFCGIEIKAGRAAIQGKENRATLFACVPDWDLSRCKSSKQILEEFGYERDGEFKLYCTVSAKTPNSQKLIFEFSGLASKKWTLI